MNIEEQIQTIEQKVESLIQDEPGVFLVEVRIKPTNNIKVFVDADTGVSIDKLVQYNRKLYKEIEESGLFIDGDFSLEVSSPGVDEPLKLHRQYVKNIGRNVEVLKKDGVKTEGKLIGVSGAGIVVEEVKGKNSHGRPLAAKASGGGTPKGKKQEIVTHAISFDNIKTTIIQIKF
jgi:ribosome maturation factor RimP